MELYEKMSHFPFLAKLSTASLKLLNENSTYSCIEGKKTLLEKGDQVGGVFLIQSGCLRVFHIDIKGQETTLYTILAGESCILALNCVFSDIRYPAWVESDEGVNEILMIPPAIFKRFFETEDLVRKFTFESLSQRTFQLIGFLEERATLNLEQRIANFLLTRANTEGILHLSQQEMANHLGSPREVVSRILNRFTKQGGISTQRKMIRVENPAFLRKYLVP